MTQALYRKWRPQTWNDVVGQQHVIQTLRQAVANGRVAHAYLFSGPRGTGKTTTARLLAKAVNCTATDPSQRPCNECPPCHSVNENAFLDLIEIDAASNTSVEDVRDLRERVAFTPSEGRYKVYIIDEVHMLSTAAFNALLKTLEEPPAHVLFILATTEAHKIPATVVSRCQRHEFRRLSISEIVEQLEEIAKEEGWQTEKEALEAVARQATGSLRDAVSLLDQLGSLGEPITLRRTLDVLGAAGNEAVQSLVECIAASDSSSGLQIIHRSADAGTDSRQFARQMVDYLRGVMLAASGNEDIIEATADSRERMRALASKMDSAALLRAIRAFSQAASDSRSGWRPQLPLELAFLDSIGASNKGSSAPLTTPPPSSQKPASHPTEPPASTPTIPRVPESRSAPNPFRPVSTETVPAKTEPLSGTNPMLSLARAKEAWSHALASLKERDGRTHTICSGAWVEAVEGGAIHLAFSAELMKQKAARSDTLTAVQTALAEVLGHAVTVRCVIAKPHATNPLGNYAEGGMVDTAAKELGAQIIDLP